MKYPTKIYESNAHGVYSSMLVRSMSEPIEIPPPEPEIACHSTVNHVWFGFEQIDDEGYGIGGWTEDQRYAIKVGNHVFNADHSLSILGQQFELGGRVFSIPYSSGSSAAIYLDDYTDETPVRVRFIPSPNSEHNTIYDVNEGYYSGDSEVEYVNKDTEFTVCLKPELTERVFTCAGATNKLVLNFDTNTPLPESIYLGINNKWSMTFDLDTMPVSRYQFGYSYDYENDIDYEEWISASLEGNELTISFETNLLNQKYRLSLYSLSDELADDSVTVVEGHNPTAYYDQRYENVNACLIPNELP